MKLSKKLALAICAVLVLSSIFAVTAFATKSNDSLTCSKTETSSTSTEAKQKKTSLNSGKKDGKHGTHVNVLSVAASVLGKSEDEIKEYVKTGKVGDLLVSAGKVDAFKTAYLKEAKLKIDAAVIDGTLTQAQADEKYAAEKTKMDSYDGTTHLCGCKDHSKMFEKSKINSNASTSVTK